MDDSAESMAVRLPNPIFLPHPDTVASSQMTAFIRYCEAATSRTFADYSSFEAFSVKDFRLFWRLFLLWSGLVYEGQLDPVCLTDSCESASFFPTVRLNYTEVLLADRFGSENRPALTACHGNGRTERLSRRELRESALRLAVSLRRLGVCQGDRVVAVARNGSEAIIAALATAALGATFSSCSPDMGAFAILTRLAPLEPVVLMGHLRPEPWDIGIPVADRLAEVEAGLPTLKAVVAFDKESAPRGLRKPLYRFSDLILQAADDDEFEWRRFPFNEPLFILFSSGTTGQPKCIVHGAGGTLLEHVKEHRLHCDLKRGDKLFFQTSCAWMMWQWQLSALASEAELVLYDGPIEGAETLWRLVASERVTVFGTNPAYLQFCEEARFAPKDTFDLRALRAVLSTGSILYERQYDWVRDNVSDLPLQSISGGTDIIGCFVLGNPNLPVYRGEAQCRSLGLDVRALPPADEPTAPIGELICANPFPSRPLGFYGDATHSRFHEAYFNQNPGVWTHGDLIETTPQGGARLHGRSDGVLNIRGIRVGPAEIYRILRDISDVVEAMAVEQQAEEELGGVRMVLLVVLREGVVLDDRLAARIRSELARRGSNALQPARIVQVHELPVTHNGKRSEAAARDAVNGRRIKNREALRNPECLEVIANHPIVRARAATGVISGTENSSASITAAGVHEVDRLKLLDQLEHELKQICERVLHQSPISRRDNFFELGGHSLMVLSLFKEIRALTHSDLPLAAFFRAPTIESLTTLILETGNKLEAVPSHATAENGSGGLSEKECGHFSGWRATLHAAAHALGFRVSADAANTAVGDGLARALQTDASLPRVRPARQEDVEPLCTFLHLGFAKRIGVDIWRRLFDYEWLDQKPNLGFVLTLGDEIVGFLGTVYARRQVRDRSGVVCNFTAWYILPEYRGWGPALLTAALDDQDVCYTSLTPSPTSVRMFEAMGFKCLDSQSIIFFPLLHLDTLRGSRPEIIFDFDGIRSLLNDDQRLIFNDHLAYECLHLVLRDGAECAYLVVKRRRQWRMALSELFYCSAPHILARHLERAKLAILRRQRTVALMADLRLFRTSVPRGVRIRRQEQALFRSSLFAPEELDNLYSELVLLPI
jgi:acetoacetyl-CoA synthetase